MDVAAVSQALSIPRSSAYELVAALSALGYVHKAKDGLLSLSLQSSSILDIVHGDSNRALEAVARALRILSLLGERKSSIAVLSRAIGVDEKTTSAFLRVLQASGFVERDSIDDSTYRLGPRVFQLWQLPRKGVLPDVASPVLRDLARKTRETVKLATLQEGRAVIIYAIESPLMLRTRGDVGVSVSLHCTAIGKALLAFLPDGEVRRVLTAPLRRHTPSTIVRRQAVRAELAVTRQRGWALDHEESEPQVRCIGAPILTPDGAAVASISVSGPASRLTDVTVQRYVRFVVAAAYEISRRLAREDIVPGRR